MLIIIQLVVIERNEKDYECQLFKTAWSNKLNEMIRSRFVPCSSLKFLQLAIERHYKYIVNVPKFRFYAI